MTTFRRLSTCLITLLCCFALSNALAASSTNKGKQYINSKYRISITLPAGWQQMSKKQIDAKLKHASNKTLIALFYKKLNKHLATNAQIRFVPFSKKLPNTTDAESLLKSARMASSQSTQINYAPVTTKTINGTQYNFMSGTISLPTTKTKFTQDLYVNKTKGGFLFFILTATQKSQDQLSDFMSGVRLMKKS